MRPKTRTRAIGIGGGRRRGRHRGPPSGQTRAATETGGAADKVSTAADTVALKSHDLRSEVESFLVGVKAA